MKAVRDCSLKKWLTRLKEGRWGLALSSPQEADNRQSADSWAEMRGGLEGPLGIPTRSFVDPAYGPKASSAPIQGNNCTRTGPLIYLRLCWALFCPSSMDEFHHVRKWYF
jgi:hypothetical protein